MANSGMYIVNLGKDPEELQIGERTLVKLRCAEKAGSKKAETRWFTALVGGPDVEVAMRLKSGDTVAVAGELVWTKYVPKSGPNKGKPQFEDEMTFAKLSRVIKSPSFFEGQPSPAEDHTAGNLDLDLPPDLDIPL